MTKKLLSNSYISTLCTELGMIIHSGISANEGIYMIMQDENDKYIHSVLNKLYKNTENGKRLADAARSVGAFPEHMLNMLDIGERTGRLDDVLSALSDYYNRQELISKSIRNAIMFPSLLLFILLLVVVVIVTQVIPIFNEVFEQLGAQMSGLASSIMSVGSFINSNALWIIAFLLLFLIACIILSAIPSAKQAFIDRFYTMFGGTRVIGKITAARFASAMSMTLSSGLDINESLDMIKALGLTKPMMKKVDCCKKHIEDGASFSSAVSQSGIFPPLFCRMLAIGVKTGSTDDVMAKIARRSEENVSSEIDRVLGKIEPVIVVLMSLLVGVILLSVMLPLLSIMTSLS